MKRLSSRRGVEPPFGGGAHAKKASEFVKWADFLDAAGPLVEQLGGVILEIADEVMARKEADEREQQRLEQRRQLRAEAEKLENEAAVNFDLTCDGLRHWLLERLSAISSSRESPSEQLKQLEKSAASIENLIVACP